MMQILKSGRLPFNGIFVAVAVVIMILYAFYYTYRKKYDVSTLVYITPAAIFFGFAGARFMYVTVCDQLYIDPADKWNLADGGYALYGAAAGVILTVVVWWLLTKRRFKMLKVMDALCISAPLAIALGRMGSVFSGDCFGVAVNNEKLRFFPVAIYKESGSSYHYAVFFYEAVFCLLIFFFIRFIDGKVKRSGTASFLFVTLYCSARSFFEGIREDSMYLTWFDRFIGFARINQVISILTVIGLFIYISIKLCRLSGFKWKYLILYAIVTVSLVIAVFSVKDMDSESEVWNNAKILICCSVIAVTVSYTGLLYAIEAVKKKKAEHKKSVSDKTQQFSIVK